MSKPKPKPAEADEYAYPMEPAPALPPKPVGILAHYSSLPSEEGSGVITTLDLSDKDNAITLQRALSGESLSLWDMPPGSVILVSHLAASFAERVDEETGETVRGTMLTLIGPDGVWHTGSMFAYRVLQIIGACVGPPPWNPPLRLQPMRIRSRNGREFQSICLALNTGE